MQIDPKEIEELSKALYVRALKLLPPDIKAGFQELVRRETDALGRTVLDTMIENIAVAERTDNLLCQDTGIPIYNVTIGRGVQFGDRDVLVGRMRDVNGARSEEKGLAPPVEQRNVGREWEDRRVEARYGGEASRRHLEDVLDPDPSFKRRDGLSDVGRVTHGAKHHLGFGRG